MSVLQLLLLEPNLQDAQKVQAALLRGGIDCQLVRVDACANFVKALETSTFDLILSDYSLPGFDGGTPLEIARHKRPETPFIFVSTSVGEELAIEALERGATGFVLKHRLERLVPCVHRALQMTEERQRKQVEAQLYHLSEADLRESQARQAATSVGMGRLYELYATLATGIDLKTALDEILAVACEFTQTERGCVQLVSDDGTQLEMFTWRGYSDDSPFINHFRYEGFKQGCDTVRVARQRFMIEETIGYPGLEGTEAGAAVYAEGIRAAQSTPIINRSGESIGVLSTQFSQPHRPSDDELKLVDLLAWTAADFVERHRAYTALRASEEKYRSLFTSIDEGFCLIEVLFDANQTPYNYRFLEVNRAFEEQTGLSNAVGKTILELVPDFQPQWAEHYGQVAKSGEAVRFEASVPSMKRIFDAYAFPSRVSGENIVAVLFTDITERKRREANLAFLVEIQDDCARLTTADAIMQTVGAKVGAYLNLSVCAFVDIDEAHDRAIVDHNWHQEDAPNLMGTYRISEFVNEAFYGAARAGEIVVVNDTNSDARTHAKTCATLNIQAFIHVPLLQDGQWKFLFNGYDSCPRQWREDEVDLFRELANQIFLRLERARAEEAVAADLRDTQLLRELAARSVTESDVQTLYQDLISAAISITQAQAGTIQLLNASTHELVLLAVQNFMPVMFEHFSRVDVSSNTSCGMALRNGKRTFVDFDVPESEDPDGFCRVHIEAGYLSAQSTPLITRFGRAIGMISTHWCDHYRPSDRELRFLDLLARQAADLIEQRQAAAERERLLQQTQAARAEAERANRVKDEFLAVLSHELRSPLNPILGWTRLLQSGNLDATRQRLALATIERNAKLQTQLIEDLLDISRIMQGKLSLTVASVNLVFVITAAVETVRLAAEAKQIQILLDLTTEIAPVLGDAARLQQAIWNLLGNAVKFTPNGGRVTVELRQIDQLAQIRVIDTGKGIDPQFLPHVFEYFRQADSTTTRKFGGLGLGLAIVRQIVEMHGGTAKAESLGEDRGATFTVQLPVIGQVVPTRSEGSQPQAENLEVSLSNLQILIVDDEADTREFQAFLLEQSGARVTAVASGLEALQVFDRFIPDVLVSDVGMAEMDGYMLIQRIRSRSPQQGGTVPAIALTAYARDFDLQNAFQSGFQAHITKPVESEVLIKTITSLLYSNKLSV